MNRFYVKLSSLLVLLGACLAVLKYPDIHNHYLFPLGRLHRSISPGDGYNDIRDRFLRYYGEQTRLHSDPRVQFHAGIRDRDFAGNSVVESSYLSLFDVSVFGTLQLGILFDDNDRVKHIFYAAE